MQTEAFVIKTYWDLKKLKYEGKSEMNSDLGSKKVVRCAIGLLLRGSFSNLGGTAGKRMQLSHVKVKNVITGHN